MFISVAIERVDPATATTPVVTSVIVPPETVNLPPSTPNWQYEAVARVSAKHAEEINKVPETSGIQVYVKSAF